MIENGYPQMTQMSQISLRNKHFHLRQSASSADCLRMMRRSARHAA
jgi:hypothetical protein